MSPMAQSDLQGTPGTGRKLSFIEAMAAARRAIALFTDLAVDSVVSCEAQEGGWRAIIDVVEAPARLGDNDLLASYEITLSSEGDVTGFNRQRRYHREDKGA